MNSSLTQELSAKGYWPAVAEEYFQQEKYSRAVELCQIRLAENPDVISGRIVLAKALFKCGQFDVSEEQFRKVLQKDPENLVALKYMGDLIFRTGDTARAFLFYERVQKLDSHTSGLSSAISEKPIPETKVLTLRKGEEKSSEQLDRLREIPFHTETLGDLLLAQGHPRLALRVFREIAASGKSPKLIEKIEMIEEDIESKE